MPEPFTRVASTLPVGTAFSRYLMCLGAGGGDMATELLARRALRQHAARLAQRGIEIWFYQDGTRFSFRSFGENVVGFVRAEMNAEFRRQIPDRHFRAAVLREPWIGTAAPVSGMSGTSSRAERPRRPWMATGTR